MLRTSLNPCLDRNHERWIALHTYLVGRTNNTLLYDRLKARGYKEAKVEENLQCEIFQTILDEAKESYRLGQKRIFSVYILFINFFHRS